MARLTWDKYLRHVQLPFDIRNSDGELTWRIDSETRRKRAMRELRGLPFDPSWAWDENDGIGPDADVGDTTGWLKHRQKWKR